MKALVHERLKERTATAEEKSAELSHSRMLDVHRWSDHQEVKAFVDAIYDSHFKGRKAKIEKKHLKVVLLDLYVAWSNDPELKIAYSRNFNDYEAGSRYNALHISKLTIKVVDRLVEVGLVEQAKGYKDRETNKGRISRMWPTAQLIEKFKETRFGPFDIGNFEGQEVIILRDGEGKEMPYDETPELGEMRGRLNSYNALLRSTFIDIPILADPFIELKQDRYGRTSKLFVNQWDKIVRRIFNRGSFEKGGRFWGGWWQRCPKEWRARIFIDDEPTTEIDYSGLHVVMLYAMKGIDYWSEVGEDPYELSKADFLASKEQTREVAKQLLLMAFNARNEEGAFRAFRDQAEAGSLEKTLTNQQLKSLLQQLKDKHPPMEEFIASDAGIDLMNKDAQITDAIMQIFAEQFVPVLTIHDSFIVPYGREKALEDAMRTAFRQVMGIRGAKLKEETKRAEAILDRHFQARDPRDPAANALLAVEYNERMDPYRSDRYRHQWSQFQAWREEGWKKTRVGNS